MAKKELVENIVKLYSKLGGNMNDVLGSRSNVTFLGKGSNPEPFIDLDINMEAVGVLGKSKTNCKHHGHGNRDQEPGPRRVDVIKR